MTLERSEPIEVAEIIHEKPLAGACDEVLYGSDRGNTLWVRFSDRDGAAEWIGKFGCGSSSAMHVRKVQAPDRFMIVAGGFAYLVAASKRELLNQYLEPFAQEIAYAPDRNLFVVADYVRIRLVDSRRVIWSSPRIALDGIRNLTVDGNLVRGLAVTGYEGEEEQFTVDLESRKVSCLTDYSSWDSLSIDSPKRASKPWWKFWR